MHFSKFKFLLSIICLMILIYSCTKDSIIDESISEFETTGLRGERSLDAPTVEVDRFSFRDIEHFKRFYTALNDIYTADDQLFNSTVASNLSGISTVHDKLINDEFVNPEDMYRPFLSDPVMMAFSNEHFEFQIENSLVTYMNNREILISDISDYETQSEIRNISKGSDLDLSTIPERAYLGEDSDISSFFTWCGCNLYIRKTNCDQVKVYGNCRDAAFGSGQANVVIYRTPLPNIPNDPVNQPIIDADIEGHFSFTIDIHPLTESVYVHAQVNPDCWLGNTQTRSYEFDRTEASCDPFDRNTPYLWAQDNGSQGFSHRTSTYKTWQDITYEEAKMWSKIWDGSKWANISKDLEVTIETSRKNPLCLDFESETETKTCFCDNKRARVNSASIHHKPPIHHCDGDVTGTFKKTQSWQGDTWSIDAVGEVEFECCQP